MKKLPNGRPIGSSWAAENSSTRPLANALRGQVIAGAATDVFAEEPPSAADPLHQAHDDHILLSPHIAGVSSERAQRIMMMAAENIGRVLAGQDPLYVVNP